MALYIPSSFADDAPYPPIQAEHTNREYARMMLYNIGSCSSEMTAVGSYFYYSVAFLSSEPELAECFHKLSVTEMRHLHMFGELAALLGADPRLWFRARNRMQYWSPGCIDSYTRDPLAAIRASISREKNTIIQYRRQASQIQDPYICAVLERILLDEAHHVVILEKMGRSLREGDDFRETESPNVPLPLKDPSRPAQGQTAAPCDAADASEGKPDAQRQKKQEQAAQKGHRRESRMNPGRMNSEAHRPQGRQRASGSGMHTDPLHTKHNSRHM